MTSADLLPTCYKAMLKHGDVRVNDQHLLASNQIFDLNKNKDRFYKSLENNVLLSKVIGFAISVGI